MRQLIKTYSPKLNCRFIISLLLISIAFCLQASNTIVRAKLDSMVMVMGKIGELQLSIDQAKGAKGSFPILSQLRENGTIGICGDSVELRSPSSIDTVEKNGRLNIKFNIPVQSFDSGYYQLPEFAFVIGNDTSYSNSVALKIVPVIVDDNTPIDDYANVADPEDASIFDAIPDWAINYWWAILLAALAIATFIYLWIKYKKDGAILPKKPEPTPYEKAIASLRELKEKKLWEQGLEKDYFTELTDILRHYMQGRFGINAMEMTSREILGSLKDVEDAKEQRKYIRQIVNMADFVKFAKVRPLPEDNVAAYENAMQFVKETKPKPVEETDQNGDTNKKGGKK